MPVRRTSPRRSATRPSTAFDGPSSDLIDEGGGDGPAGMLAGAAPWLALLALVLAAGTIGYLLLNRGSGGSSDLTACRTAAWGAVPAEEHLPQGWTLGSTDLNANGITVSILNGTTTDDSSNPPVVYASVTCYGDGAAAALEANRSAARAAGSRVEPRPGGDDAFDLLNPSTASTTTIFRVGSLVAQVANAGEASRDDLDTITGAVARAMGDPTAAGSSPNGPDTGAAGSEEPSASEPVAGESSGPYAPELEALLPTKVGDKSPGASPGATIDLTVDSASYADAYGGQDPASRALSARLRTLGKTVDDLQVAQAFDETGVSDLVVLGFRLPGADGAKLREAILDAWLSAKSEGVKTTTPTLGGKTVTKVDYGDGRAFEYVYAQGDVVIDVETADEAIATEVLAALK
jgi:hypothetical protein